ncbi:hypothetical protein QFZ82_007067 [Streptomyces sp. V4I23]|nr:hypothetical protein [Streptomyces sp. V4I23]
MKQTSAHADATNELFTFPRHTPRAISVSGAMRMRMRL